MPEGKTMVLSVEEYPQLMGMEVGAEIPEISIRGSRVVESNEGSVTLEMGPWEFKTENGADKELRGMTGAPRPGSERLNHSYDTEY